MKCWRSACSSGVFTPALDMVASTSASFDVEINNPANWSRINDEDAAPAPDEITEPSEPRARKLLEQYIAAFENADTAMLKRALRHDAALEMVGSRTWFAGQPVAA
jgi:RNA polymerase sigma-70 factor, ECF subfamily